MCFMFDFCKTLRRWAWGSGHLKLRKHLSRESWAPFSKKQVTDLEPKANPPPPMFGGKPKRCKRPKSPTIGLRVKSMFLWVVSVHLNDSMCEHIPFPCSSVQQTHQLNPSPKKSFAGAVKHAVCVHLSTNSTYTHTHICEELHMY